MPKHRYDDDSIVPRPTPEADDALGARQAARLREEYGLAEPIPHRTIYEPGDIIPDSASTVPNVEIIPGLRAHFYEQGIAFGLVGPPDERFAVLIPYAKARELMLRAAKEQNSRGKEEV